MTLHLGRWHLRIWRDPKGVTFGSDLTVGTRGEYVRVVETNAKGPRKGS